MKKKIKIDEEFKEVSSPYTIRKLGEALSKDDDILEGLVDSYGDRWACGVIDAAPKYTPPNNPQFKSRSDELVFILTKMDGAQRCDALGITDAHYEHEMLADSWFNSLRLQLAEANAAGTDYFSALKKLEEMYNAMISDSPDDLENPDEDLVLKNNLPNQPIVLVNTATGKEHIVDFNDTKPNNSLTANERWKVYKNNKINIFKDALLIQNIIDEHKDSEEKNKMNDIKRVLIPIDNLNKVKELNVSPSDVVTAYLMSIAENDPNVFYKELIDINDASDKEGYLDNTESHPLSFGKLNFTPITKTDVNLEKYTEALSSIKQSLDYAIKGNIVNGLLKTHDVEIVEPCGKNSVTVVLTDNRRNSYNTIFDVTNIEHWASAAVRFNVTDLSSIMKLSIK